MNKVKKHTLFFVFFLFSISSFGQDHWADYNRSEYRNQQNKLFVYNILLNGFISGVGGVVNKNTDEKFFTVLSKSFGKGCLGGFVKYLSKSQAYYLKDYNNTFLAPVNRAFFFLGHSITMNGSLNQKTLENLYLNFYGINFNYQPFETKGDRFNARLSLGTLSSIIYFSASGHKLDLYKSLEYGQFYFELNPSFKFEGELGNGLAFYNVFAIRNIEQGTIIIPLQSSVPHEIVHTYQHYDFFAFSSLYKNKINNEFNKLKLYKVVSKYVQFDYEPLYYFTMYQLQPKPIHFKNFFEFEAEHFETRDYINR